MARRILEAAVRRCHDRRTFTPAALNRAVVPVSVAAVLVAVPSACGGSRASPQTGSVAISGADWERLDFAGKVVEEVVVDPRNPRILYVNAHADSEPVVPTMQNVRESRVA
jgi:hypothetical protein